MKYLDTMITFSEFPDEIALCINITNCPFHCPGCHSPELWEDIGTELTFDEVLKLIDFAIEQGTNYFTFNIPMSECKNCGHVVNAPIQECPKCGSKNIDYWTRIIGYLRPVSAFSNPRKIEQKKRVYGTNENIG